MSRHVIDRSTAPEGGRLKHYLEVEKSRGAEGSSPAAKSVHTRPVARKSVARVREFIRIEKGRMA